MKTKSKPEQKKIQLKVMDFSIWNGMKFGFGFMLGTTIGSIALMLLGFFFMFILGYYIPNIPV